MLSIFAAVLIFSCTKHLSVDYFGEQDEHTHAPPDLKTFLISLVRLLVLFALMHCLIYGASTLRPDLQVWSMKSVGIVGGHIIGFAGIEVFGGLLEQPFSQGFMCVVIVSASIIVFSAFLYVVSHKLVMGLGNNGEYHEVARESQHDGACLCYGLLISMLVRYAIAGHIPPVHGAPKDKSHLQVLILFAVTVLFGVLVVVIGNLTAAARRENRLSPMATHVLDLAQITCSMTMGWCGLFWGQWCFWSETGGNGVGTGSKMSARMLMAMIFSMGCFAAIRIVDFFADRMTEQSEKGLRQLLSTFGIVMGLTWEACFTEAIDGIANDYEGASRIITDVGLTLVLSVVVLPAWALYILPKVMDENEDKKKEEPSSLTSLASGDETE